MKAQKTERPARKRTDYDDVIRAVESANGNVDLTFSDGERYRMANLRSALKTHFGNDGVHVFRNAKDDANGYLTSIHVVIDKLNEQKPKKKNG